MDKGPYNFMFTIFTPTYNRAHLLPRAYKSLLEQTFRDFEWIVIDDGSTDNTAELVRQWQREADFPIRYYWQENSGKHVAHNRAVQLAQGRLFVVLDSDDWLVSNALERVLHHWVSIPASKRDEYVAVVGLYVYPSGEIVGTRFPEDIMDANAITIRTIYKVEGDKFGVNRTDVLREYPFPEDLGHFVTEALVWRRIALKYKERYVNEVFAYKEYQEGGLTDPTNPLRALKIRIESPHAERLAWREFAEFPPEMVPYPDRAQAYIQFVRFSLHGRVSIFRQFREARDKRLFLLALPRGLRRYLRDKRRLKTLT